MSIFRVNTNSLAMTSLRILQNNGSRFSDSMNKLSTGLRINNAGDDPAGLIVSESFRAQIAGLDAAVRNNQDAINYTKTAEAALDEVSRLLRDARALAIASSNTATLDDTQRQANQNQLNSIIQSITRISESTAFGTKKLLDGSSGTVAISTDGANVANMSFSGVFSGRAVSQNSTVTVEVTTPATRAQIVAATTYALATSTVPAGSFTINGITFTTASSDTIGEVVARINSASVRTGVTASWADGDGVTLTSVGFGSESRLNLVDSSGILDVPGALESTGVDAVAEVTVDLNGTDPGGEVVQVFDSGRGLTLRDNFGNVILLTEAGNASSGAAAWGQVLAGAATFQIGANANQTTSLSLGNFAASELGRGVVSNRNLGNISILNVNDAAEAMRVIDKSISDVSSSRGNIGNFMRNILESNVRSLSIQRENLAATESSIRDVDVAMEMANFTKLQILQQSGIAMLAQANQAPQAVLSLLRG